MLFRRIKMCGIAGFTWNDKPLLKKMCSAIAHRGPDQDGFYENTNISLGHRRLSIIDLSEKGRQPMFNEDGSIALVFNGEIYNFKPLREDLLKKGHSFNSETDSEVIIHAYEEYGESCVSLFNGMFAFAIWDSAKQKLFLARDRAGIKPLYYYYNNNKLIFASELKAILQYPELKKTINKESLQQFLQRKVVFGENTILEGIKKLLPGYTLTLAQGKLETNPFYTFAFSSKSDNFNFEPLFSAVIKDMLVADVPLGVFLSGGLDSSMITAFMAQQQTKVKTFTVGYDLPTDEFRYSKLVAEKFSTDHHELIISFNDMTKALDKIIWHMDEPNSDPAIIPTYFMAQFARKKVAVCLTGEGSDELFAGYKKYARTHYMPKWLYYKLTDVIFTPGETKKLVKNPALKQDADYLKPYLRIPDRLNSAATYEFQAILPNFYLMKTDKMTMAHALEARVPFLDNRMIQLGSELKNKYKLQNQVGKYCLRQVAKNILPKNISTDKKRSFFTPLKDWFNKDLMEIATADLEKSELFNKKEVEKVIHNQKTSFRRYKYAYQLWTLYLLEKWHQKYLQ